MMPIPAAVTRYYLINELYDTVSLPLRGLRTDPGPYFVSNAAALIQRRGKGTYMDRSWICTSGSSSDSSTLIAQYFVSVRPQTIMENHVGAQKP
jgi:hypothetical protein